ncbi:MAG: purine-nucleoside phosphorylase [Rikenellaceae bacterium]
MLKRIKRAAEYISSKTDGFTPQVGVVLGSGLGGFAQSIEVKYRIPYSEIPEFPVTTVIGHSGELVMGYLAGVAVMVMRGRFHYYEGYNMGEVTMGIRVMKLLGIETLFVSNAAGGVNMSYDVGDLMVITDHINLMPNPLIGQNMEEFGTRFPDMHDCYTPRLIELARGEAQQMDLKLQYGVYVSGTGPTFETQAEYRYIGIIGGDATGMSTVPEVIVARHCGIEVFGVSIITNCGLSDQIGDHEDVQRVAAEAAVHLATLFYRVIAQLKRA